MKKRNAFTALELMIAIGILVILGALVMAGLKSATGSAKTGDNKIILENARAMLAELEAVSPSDYAYIKNGWPTAPAPAITPGIAAPTGSMKDGEPGRDGPEVQQTEWVFMKLRAVPANRTAMGNLPADKLYTPKNAAAWPAAYLPRPAGEPPLPVVPILKDAYGNPMLFVPPQGLANVVIKDMGTFTIRSSGRVAAAGAAMSGSDRPFFASAGPDGIFTTGDDNQYSFEN